MSLEAYINLFLNSDYIMSGYNVLYKNQDNSINLGALALESLLSSRKFYKDKMEASEWGSAEYIYYKILQMTYKVLANSYYGILGEKNSIFYNPFIQNSITMTGQDIITTSIMAMESFLANNAKFRDTDDAITYVRNICRKSYEISATSLVDKIPDESEVIEYLISHVEDGFEINRSIIEPLVRNLSDEQRVRVFYTNRVYDLIFNNSHFIEGLKNILRFTYFDKPNEEIADNLETFKKEVINICHYDYLYEDRYRRALKNMRKSVIVVDTDSNFINIDPYVKKTSEILGFSKDDSDMRISAMNVYINIVTEILKNTFWTFTTNMNLIDRCKPIINMKSEFIYKRILLTKNKKNYSGIIIAELGKLLKEPQMDTKGLAAIKKTNVPKKLRRQFMEILRGDILEAENIDLKKILRKYDGLGDDIRDSLRERNTEYLLPKNAELIETYELPDQIEPIRGVLIWNELEPENQIVLPEKINLLKLKELSTDSEEFIWLKENHPEKFNAVMKVVYNEGVSNPKLDISRFGFTSVAIPKSVEKIPEYLIPFIDFNAMVNNNISNGYVILESLGVYISQVKKFQYKSNLVRL